MATQKGIIKFTGLLGGISFYKSRHGYYARKKSNLSGKRVRTDRAFEPTMQYAQEFAAVARLNKALRSALKNLPGVEDNKSTMLRLNKLLLRIKALDKTSPQGMRSVQNGLQTTEGKKLLNDFCLGDRRNTFSIPARVDTASGEAHIPAFDPIKLFTASPGATHLRLELRVLEVDPVQARTTVVKTEPLLLDLKEKTDDLKFRVPAAEGMIFYVLSISFCKEGHLLEGRKNSRAFILAVSVELEKETANIRPVNRRFRIYRRKRSIKRIYCIPERKKKPAVKNRSDGNTHTPESLHALARAHPLIIPSANWLIISSANQNSYSASI